MNEPKIGIVLVNYNGMKDTEECINSLFKIQYKNIQIIIVDNKSTKQERINPSILEDKRVSLISLEKNYGFAGGNNIGAKFAFEKYKCEYVLLLNNDTLVEPDFLNYLFECAYKYNNQAVITGKIFYYFDKKSLWYAGGELDLSKALTKHYYDDRLEKEEAEPSEVSFASGCLLLVPKNIFLEIQGLEEKYFLYYEDADFCCKVKKSGYKIIYCPKSIIYHKVNASTGTMSNTSIYYGTRNRFLFVKEYGTNPLRGYVACIAMSLRCFLKKPKRFLIIVKAIRDFLNKNNGFQSLSGY